MAKKRHTAEQIMAKQFEVWRGQRREAKPGIRWLTEPWQPAKKCSIAPRGGRHSALGVNHKG